MLLCALIGYVLVIVALALALSIFAARLGSSEFVCPAIKSCHFVCSSSCTILSEDSDRQPLLALRKFTAATVCIFTYISYYIMRLTTFCMLNY